MVETGEIKNRKNAPRTARPEDLFDPWAGWKPVWGEGGNKSPQDFQEDRTPTETVELRAGAQGRTVERCRRRVTDARLWEGMSVPQQDAAVEIERAFALISRGVGYRISNPYAPRVDHGRTNANERQGIVVAGYVSWANDCMKAKLSHAAALDILGFGKTCREVDRERRVRKGWARENLSECLFLWCKMRGWPTC